jgi:putative endonuclease
LSFRGGYRPNPEFSLLLSFRGGHSPNPESGKDTEMHINTYYVYMMSNKYNDVLYVGITGNLMDRVRQHKFGDIKGFTKQYNCNKLVYYEEYGDVKDAISREKELKKWRRDWKDHLVNLKNPLWHDLWGGIVIG